jgi:hypothetical protein
VSKLEQSTEFCALKSVPFLPKIGSASGQVIPTYRGGEKLNPARSEASRSTREGAGKLTRAGAERRRGDFPWLAAVANSGVVTPWNPLFLDRPILAPTALPWRAARVFGVGWGADPAWIEQGLVSSAARMWRRKVTGFRGTAPNGRGRHPKPNKLFATILRTIPGYGLDLFFFESGYGLDLSFQSD